MTSPPLTLEILAIAFADLQTNLSNDYAQMSEQWQNLKETQKLLSMTSQ